MKVLKLPKDYTHDLVKNAIPTMRYDGVESFEEWQDKARKKLSELLGLHNMNAPANDGFTVEWIKENDEYTDTRFWIFGEEGYSFPLRLHVPKSAKAPMPIIVCVQGHSTGMHISLGEVKYEKTDYKFINEEHCDYAAESVRRGFAALTLEMRNFGEMGAREEDGEPMCHIATMNNILLGRTTIGERVNDISRAIDAVLSHYDLFDAEKVMLMGISGGGTASYYAACIDERISAVVSIGAVCSYESSIAAMFHCTCNFVPGIVNYFGIGDLGGLIAPRKLVAVNGKRDPIFPDYGVRDAFADVKRMYSFAGVPQNCKLVSGDGGHICYPEITFGALEEMIN